MDNEVDLPDFLKVKTHEPYESAAMDFASGSGAFEEPRAEARVQLIDTSSSLHQFTNLKILTPAGEEPVVKKKRPKVYSQV